MKRYLIAFLAIESLFMVLPLSAQDFSVCPAFTPTGVGGTEIGFTGCSELITLNPDGSTTFAFNPAYPLESTTIEFEDTYVGVINNSGNTVFSLLLTGDEPFGFDSDFGLSTIGTGYEGPNTTFTFSAPAPDIGFVNFTGGLPTDPGVVPNTNTRYFGLEGAVTPEPSSFVLMGMGVVALFSAVRKKLTS